MPRNQARPGPTRDIARANFERGVILLRQHPIFAPLLSQANVRRDPAGNQCPQDGWAVVARNGTIYVHPTRRGTPGEWLYVLAHCLLHLGFGHFQEGRRPREWHAACDLFVARFLADLKLGEAPEDMPLPTGIAARDEERLYQQFCTNGLGEHVQALGAAGPRHADMLWGPEKTDWEGRRFDWPAWFGLGLAEAVTQAVSIAGGEDPTGSTFRTRGQRAREWFMNHYPLLGALAAGFRVIEDPQICRQYSISIAAVDAELRTIYLNPAAGLTDEECRFVMAHELLHVGLLHHARRRGRDPLLWNISCDYIINAWLVEMQVGAMPQMGLLYDASLKGESAEAIYDRIVTDIRRFRKLGTFRGVGLGDILEPGVADWWTYSDGIDLDDFYRRALSQGLSYHQDTGRGFLPAGLVEEIRALSQPPIPWDVALAQWFDRHFAPLEKIRSYARPSRRQSATPAIPRPRWVLPPGADDARTFGVILDTSGSMKTELLAKALGAIASYSVAREVPAARVVFCDAAAYDAGYLAPEAIADRVQIKGRGGTVLQPGVDLLEAAEDFPPNGPLLIITDGLCEPRLHIHREHAFLLPEGHHLPFVARGEIFYIR